MLLKVEDHINLARDSRSKAIINTSSENYRIALESKEKRMSLDHKFKSIDNEILSIKNDISAILEILREK